MQTLKFEMAVAGAALFALGGFVATRPTSAHADSVQPATVRAFSDADFQAFDRSFVLDETPCAVGMERFKLCFGPSPLEAGLHRGMVISSDIPLVAAEFRVIVETELKAPGLRTLRYGQTLLLVDPETRIVVDVMKLTAPNLSVARTSEAANG